MTWWQYLILVNIYLLLFYGFYVILLSRETFFQLNRLYLVAGTLLSFFIPLIQSNWVKNLFITQKVKYTIYTSPVMFYQFKPIEHTHITLGQVAIFIYLAGIALFVCRFTQKLIILKKIFNQPQATAAFSFFKKIRLGYELENNQVIAAHENVHANQWHSADILLIEAVLIINWFNPVVYMYRLAFKHIHEFIADRQALKAVTSKQAYALLLLSQTFNTSASGLVNPFFNQTLLKKRIKMLQKTNSRAVALVKYGLSAPLFVLMLVLSSATVNNSKPVRLFSKKAEQVFLTPAVSDAAEIKTNDVDLTEVTNKTIDKNIITKPVAAAVISSIEDSNPVFTAVEQVPVFPDGLQAFSNFLGKNIRYPIISREKGNQGKVIISFIVERDGSLSHIDVVRGIDNDINKEAIRVLKLSPNWVPGNQNGHSVRVAYSVPIAFTLLDDVKPIKQVDDNKNISNILITPTINNIQKGDSAKTPFQYHLKTDPIPANAVYVLEGKVIDNITDVNQNDIQSLVVIKDKATTSLYGPRAVANGIVFITLKKKL